MRQRIRLYTLVALAAACAASPPAKEFNAQQALAYIVKQVSFGPRVPGQPGHAAMLSWLDTLMHARADSVTLQTWWHKTATGDSVQMTNVLAQFKPAAASRVLYVAHWDTRPRADNDPDSANHHTPIPGADDGGSGVAVLIGVADALKKLPPDVGVDLLFVDGEDYGYFGPTPPHADVLVGAEYYATHQLAPMPMFGVLWDMVGHKNLQLNIEQNSSIAAPEAVDRVWKMAASMGYGGTFKQSTPPGGITDDHIPLINAGIKIIDVIDITGYLCCWHTLQDTPDKESVQSLDAVGNVAVGVLRRALKN